MYVYIYICEYTDTCGCVYTHTYLRKNVKNKQKNFNTFSALGSGITNGYKIFLLLYFFITHIFYL